MTTNNEAFEKAFDIAYPNREDRQSEFRMSTVKEIAQKMYNAAKAECEKEIAELKLAVQNWKDFCKKIQKVDFNDYLALENEIADLNRISDIRKRKALKKTKQIDELQAQNIQLREALERAIGYIPAYTVNKKDFDMFQEALSSAPAQSLSGHDAELIERCAKVCDDKCLQLEKKAEEYSEAGEWDEVNNQRAIAWIVNVVATAIRELKGK